MSLNNSIFKVNSTTSFLLVSYLEQLLPFALSACNGCPQMFLFLSTAAEGDVIFHVCAYLKAP